MEKNKEVKYGCHVEGAAIDDCVMDENDFTIMDCSVAANLCSQGKTKEDCEYWRPIPYTTAGELTCPKCGHAIANPSEELIESARQLCGRIKMKIEIKAEEKPVNIGYPYIGRHKEEGNLIVLFTSSDSGVCLSVGDTDNEKGEYSEEWRETSFVPFYGTITLSNY